MGTEQLGIPQESIQDFCEKWRIEELSLFGSVIRPDFRPDSDVDVLVSFAADARVGLWDMAAMVIELESLFGRKVDLVEKEGIRNPFRRESILSKREIVYAA